MSRAQLKDEVFMNMALELSRLGTCCRLQVGAVLLRGDGGVAAAGFNGALPGMAHCTPETCRPGQRCLHTSHAEENALGFCDGAVATAYVTHEPCLVCCRAWCAAACGGWCSAIPTPASPTRSGPSARASSTTSA